LNCLTIAAPHFSQSSTVLACVIGLGISFVYEQITHL
jgi:hypothetical protein